MFPDLNLGGILPKTLVIAALAYGSFAYFLSGPFVAERVVRADHLPACAAAVRTLAAQGGAARIGALPPPAAETTRERAAARLRALRNSPFMQGLKELGGDLSTMLGVDDMMDLAMEPEGGGVAAAKQAYQDALGQIRAETATRLAAAGDVCGCAADAAIAETRTEWAIFAGSFSLVRPAALDGFDARLLRLQQAGACAAPEGAAS